MKIHEATVDQVALSTTLEVCHSLTNALYNKGKSNFNKMITQYLKSKLSGESIYTLIFENIYFNTP